MKNNAITGVARPIVSPLTAKDLEGSIGNRAGTNTEPAIIEIAPSITIGRPSLSMQLKIIPFG